MKEYIDKSALIEEIWKNHKETEKYYDLCVDELKDVYCGIVATIDEQPTITEAEIRAKAIDEFAERMKELFKYESAWGNTQYRQRFAIDISKIDEIAEQMKEVE